MKLLPSASKKTAGALKSSGTPSRLRSAPAIQTFSTSGSAANNASVIAVLMYFDELALDTSDGGTERRLDMPMAHLHLETKY